MSRESVLQSLLMMMSLALAAPLLAQNGVPPPKKPALSAAAIVDKNVAARGGLPAWRAVQTMTLSGKLGAGGNQRAPLATPMPDVKSLSVAGRLSRSAAGKPGGLAKNQDDVPGNGLLAQRPVEEVQLPFTMELKRPRRMRLEIQFNGQTAVQVYDGANGWKLRPFLNRLEVEPYTSEELRMASMQSDLDGPLIDYAAKGTRVEVEGTEKIEDRDTYRLKLTMTNGTPIHVWIDAQTFLEAKMEGAPRKLDGIPHPVEIYFRDYRRVDNLTIPFVLETKVLPIKKTALGLADPPVPAEKILVDEVVLNAKIEESRFSKPVVGVASNIHPGR